MNVRSAMILGRLALVFFLGVSPFVPLLAGLYPGYVVPIVLAGALIIGSPLGLALGHAVLRGLEDEFAEKYRRSERFYLLAAAASQGGLLLTSLGRGAVGALGLVLSSGGMLAAVWLLLKTSTEGDRHDSGFPASMDRGRLK